MKTTNLLSVVSAVVLVIFTILAFGSIIPAVELLEDGRHRETRQIPGSVKNLVVEGPKDRHGNWDGEVTTHTETPPLGFDARLVAVENYEGNVMHGKQVYYKEDGSIREVVYYDGGKRIPDPDESNQSKYDMHGITALQEGYFSNVEEISNYTAPRIPQIKNPLFKSGTYINELFEYFQQNTRTRRLAFYNLINQMKLSNFSTRYDRKDSVLLFSENDARSYSQGVTEVPGYGYLRYESPWYIFFIEAVDIIDSTSMLVLTFDSTDVLAFMDDIEEYISGAAPESDTEFTFAYIDALEEVGEDHDIIDLHQFIVEIKASEGMKRNELRLAVLDRLFNSGNSTFEVLEENYPDFLERLNEWVDNDEIRTFTDYLDSIIDSAEELPDIEDPLFVSIIDLFLFFMLIEMYEEEIHPDVTEAVLFILLIESAVKADPVYEAVKAVYFEVPVNVETVGEIGVPEQIKLEQNYPNPFNPSTTISYSIHQQLHTRIQVYDITGKEVATLVDEMKNPGFYKITFDASSLPSGVYIYRLQAGEHVESKRLLYLK